MKKIERAGHRLVSRSLLLTTASVQAEPPW